MRIAILMLMAFPMAATAQVTQGPALTGTASTINDGPGDQTDPHVSQQWVAYTDEVNGGSAIRYHDLSTGTDAVIPNGGGYDFLSDISGSTIVYTHLADRGAIYTFDITTGTRTELDPQSTGGRQEARIGGATVVWQDLSFSPNLLAPELVTYDLGTQTSVRLTDDTLMDLDPAVSPDGQVIAWTKCQQDETGCHIWEVTRSGTSWSTPQQLTTGTGEEANPDTNGQWVAYSSARADANGVVQRDIYWQAVGGGTEHQLSLAGDQVDPHISGNLIAFESATTESPNAHDIYVFDLASSTLYQVTNTPYDEVLDDISMTTDGTVRVVWAAKDTADYNVYGFSFKVIVACQTVTSCADPGSRPLLTSMDVAREEGEPFFEIASFDATSGEDGLLCVDNGYAGDPATAGQVLLGNHVEIDAWAFEQSVTEVQRNITLEDHNVLAAVIEGTPGSDFQVRIYGSAPGCAATQPPPDDPLPGHDWNGPIIEFHHRWGDHDWHRHGDDVLSVPVRLSGQRAVVVDAVSYIVPPTRAPANGSPEAMGCSASGGAGGGLGFMALLMVLGTLGLARKRRPEPVKVRARPRR